jgi:hypothetical protein
MDGEFERLTRLLRLAEIRRDLLAIVTIGSRLRRISLSTLAETARQRDSTRRRAA